MKTNMYIPETITIGFQKRSDTFTGKLGYVIYTDHKGVLRKAASWGSWRDHNIEPVTFPNTPTPNFTLNKGVQRDGYWGSGRSVVRVWDPRDFEFEISIDNLIGILMHADVSKRDITEPCVFAWNGTELVLLPTNSIEYQESVKHTEKQGTKFATKSLVPGHTYAVRKETRSVVYLGLFERYEIVRDYDQTDDYTRCPIGLSQKKKGKKGHAFIDPVSKYVEIKDPAAFISNVEVSEVHTDFASLMDAYYLSSESQPITNAIVVNSDEFDTYSFSAWHALNETDYVELSWTQSYHTHPRSCEGKVRRFARFNTEENRLMTSHDGNDSYYGARRIPPHTLPGLTKDMQQVTELIASLTPHIAAGFNDQSGPWEERQVARQKLKGMLFEQYGYGQLHFVLADGRNARRGGY